MKRILYLLIVCIFFWSCSTEKNNSEYYVNSNTGSDQNDGLSPKTAWSSLAKASEIIFLPGQKLLLAEGCIFKGKLELKGVGSIDKPIEVSSYNPGKAESNVPLIDAQGFKAAIQIENGSNFQISNLELTADAGEVRDSESQTKRYGVWINANQPGDYSNISLKNLNIHHIFATENVKGDGQNPSSNMGYGIFIGMSEKEARIKNVRIEDCTIEMTGHTGIRIFGFADQSGSTYLDSVTIINNRLTNIGGPGMVPGRCQNVLVRGNTVDYSGSSADPRMHNRGSGIWPWTCNNVLIEKNKFMNAWGKMDSYGTHIDYNCNNVVVQYNLSVNNSGGFVEILGNNNNCSYRYNISINDGYRQKGVNGVTHDGKVLWTSGYVGNKPRKGPFNSYVYNNTIFVKEEYPVRFSFANTTDGLLIANNIFYILGEPTDVGDNEQRNPSGETIKNVLFKNNLYQKVGIIPESVVIKDMASIFGDPQFKNPGGLSPNDYIPANISLIQDKGIRIEKIPGDDIGLTIGLKVEKDYFGKPITGLPDLGAIELN